MKTHRFITLLALSLSLTSQLRAQGGSLTPPPGPPAPVMHTLGEIYDKATALETQTSEQTMQLSIIQATVAALGERTPVNTLSGSATAKHVISTPGSYYLNASITGESGKSGIRIDAANVTLDLNGYTLTGVSGSTKGIEVYTTAPVIIRNGVLRSWSQQGIYMQNSTGFVLQDLNILNTQQAGVEINGAGRIERISVKSAADYGIYCNSANPTIIRDCRIESVIGSTAAKGIFAPKSLITHCTVTSVTGTSSGASPSNTVAGISCSGGKVEGCVIGGIVQFGTNSVSGIESAASVANTTITQVISSGSGTADATWRCAGTLACAHVTNCAIENVSSTNHHTFGINQAAHASACRIKNIQTTVFGEVETGIDAYQVLDSSIEMISDTGTAIRCTQASRNQIRNCQNGILVMAEGGHISENSISEFDSIGIAVFATRCKVVNNSVQGLGINSGICINFSIDDQDTAMIADNYLTNAARGIDARSARAMVVRNTAVGNDTNFTLHANMPVVNGTAIGTNPNANISF